MSDFSNILRGLSNALSAAADNLEGMKYYLVIARETGKPEVIEAPTHEECVQRLNDIVATSSGTPCYVFMFEGRRWKVYRNPARLVSPDGTVKVLEVCSNVSPDDNEDCL